jgi:hypothetical protein
MKYLIHSGSVASFPKLVSTSAAVVIVKRWIKIKYNFIIVLSLKNVHNVFMRFQRKKTDPQILIGLKKMRYGARGPERLPFILLIVLWMSRIRLTDHANDNADS